MRIFFNLARFYPYWALPCALICIELGRYFKRKAGAKGEAPALCSWGAAGALFFLTVLWFFFRGDLNSDAWVRSMGG